MEKIRFNLDVAKQCSLEAYKWGPSNNDFQSNAIVIIVHGMGEHVERYHDFANHLVKSGFLVYGYNHRGHKGTIKSADDYGYIADSNIFSLLVSDLHDFYLYIKKENPSLPIFLFGHSMGSFVVQRFIQLYGLEIKGVILSGSAKQPQLLLSFGILIARCIKRFKGAKYRSKFLSNLTTGNFNKPFKPNRTQYDWINTLPEEVDKYDADEYCGGVFTTSFYYGFYKGLREINKNYVLTPKDLPMFLISGENDPVGGFTKLIKKLFSQYQKLQIADLNLKIYPNARHEIIHDSCKEDVYKDTLNWLKRHLP